MFGRRKRKIQSKPNTDQITTLIGEDCEFEGNLTASSSTRIDGRLNGKVSGESILIVGEQGFVTGEIKARSIVVYGRVEGIIESQKLEIKSRGNVSGDIYVESFVVEEGGVYNGRCVTEQLSSENIMIGTYTEAKIDSNGLKSTTDKETKTIESKD
jgi:cytoskeletal protein CcmA (bactofilin family)